MNRIKLRYLYIGSPLASKMKIFLFLALLVSFSNNALAQPTATISTQAGANTCDGQPFNLILAPIPAPTGAAPFDLVINGTTYNDIPVGGVITTFTPPIENIWPITPAPPTNIDAAATLGVKFSSTVSGFVKGVRFFSPNIVAGTYTGQLWMTDGTLLASGTYTGVTPNDWQELLFTTPVLIAAGTTYIASYHTTANKYASTTNGLAVAQTNGSLTAPDNTSSGGNGVYSYGGAASFPSNSAGLGHNYWADVIFSPNNYTFDLTSITDNGGANATGTPIQSLSITSTACSALPVNIVINPPATATAVGQTFTVVVAADWTGAALNLDDIELHLAFDNTKLQVTSITEEPIAAAFTAKPIPLEAAPYTATNAAGQINYAATTTAGIPTDDFDVLSITFTVISGAGTTTPLTLRRDPPSDETRAGGTGSSVLAGVINATVTINAAGCPTPTATISAPGGATTCNSQPFDLTLSAAPVGVGPFDLTINGTTYNDIPVGGLITNFVPTDEHLWPTTLSPLPSNSSDGPVTLGVKFSSSVSGFVKGVRFFSPNVLAGTYTGQLWASDGTQLASGTFTVATINSWQELLFASPVLIAANTTYIASYHTTGAKYVGTAGGLNTAKISGSLTAPDNTTAGGNGVYIYGATPAFPNLSNGSNYWADVIFAANVYTFNLTGVKDANECANSGALQTLSVTSVDCSTLPVTFVNFSATPNDKSITLQWATSSEINNKGFEIQRSTDGTSWSAIGFVNGAENSTSTINYSFVDANLAPGRYYYRLKQIDIDLRFVYSATVSAAIGGAEFFVLEQNYPNPFSGQTLIRFSLPHKAKVNLSLFDMNGRLVKVLINESKDSGTHAITFNSGTLTSGLYFYKMQTGDFSAVKKLTIQ